MNEPLSIVGLGEIGRRFANAAETLKTPFRVITRDRNQELLSARTGGPLLLCVREGDLQEVLAKIPPERAGDVVFTQNGFVDELIAAWPGSTRAVLWFTAKGTFFADILQSPVHGPHADLVRGLITATGATAESIADPDVFRRYALEKAIWSCVVGAPLAAWNVDLATARHERMADIEAIVNEACDVVRVALGQEISQKRVVATLDDTSKQLGWMRGGTKAAAWRNGKVVEWGERCGVPTPANRAILDAIARMSSGRTTEVE